MKSILVLTDLYYIFHLRDYKIFIVNINNFIGFLSFSMFPYIFGLRKDNLCLVTIRFRFFLFLGFTIHKYNNLFINYDFK